MIQRLTALVLEPDKAFTEIVREEKFLTAWLLSIAFFAAPIIVLVHRVPPSTLFGSLAQVEAEGATPEQLSAALLLVVQALAILVPAIAVPLTAVCVMPMSGGATLRRLLAATAYATLLPSIGICVTGFVVMAARPAAQITFGALSPLNLGMLVPARFALLHNIASTLELFSAWSIYLLAHGIAAAGTASFRRVFLQLALPLIFVAWTLAAIMAVL